MTENMIRSFSMMVNCLVVSKLVQVIYSNSNPVSCFLRNVIRLYIIVTVILSFMQTLSRIFIKGFIIYETMVKIHIL